MSAEIIDGRAFALKVRTRVTAQVRALKDQHGLTPGLAVVLVGDDPASHVYVRNKNIATVEAGMKSEEIRLPDSASQEEVLAIVATVKCRREHSRYPGSTSFACSSG